MRIRTAAAIEMTLAVVNVEADNVLWCKHWYPKPPSALDRVDRSFSHYFNMLVFEIPQNVCLL